MPYSFKSFGFDFLSNSKIKILEVNSLKQNTVNQVKPNATEQYALISLLEKGFFEKKINKTFF